MSELVSDEPSGGPAAVEDRGHRLAQSVWANPLELGSAPNATEGTGLVVAVSIPTACIRKDRPVDHAQAETTRLQHCDAPGRQNQHPGRRPGLRPRLLGACSMPTRELIFSARVTSSGAMKTGLVLRYASAYKLMKGQPTRCDGDDLDSSGNTLAPNAVSDHRLTACRLRPTSDRLTPGARIGPASRRNSPQLLHRPKVRLITTITTCGDARSQHLLLLSESSHGSSAGSGTSKPTRMVGT